MINSRTHEEKLRRHAAARAFAAHTSVGEIDIPCVSKSSLICAHLGAKLRKNSTSICKFFADGDCGAVKQYPKISVSIPEADLRERLDRRLEELGHDWSASRYICWALKFSLDHHSVATTEFGDRILVAAHGSDAQRHGEGKPVSSLKAAGTPHVSKVPRSVAYEQAARKQTDNLETGIAR